MTRENVYIVDLIDLSRVRLECKSCGAATTMHVATWEKVHGQCASCGTEWMISLSPQHQALNKLSFALRELQAGEKDAKYRLRFELKAEDE